MNMIKYSDPFLQLSLNRCNLAELRPEELSRSAPSDPQHDPNRGLSV